MGGGSSKPKAKPDVEVKAIPADAKCITPPSESMPENSDRPVEGESFEVMSNNPNVNPFMSDRNVEYNTFL